jgi:fatty-acyl-CoA synthase
MKIPLTPLRFKRRAAHLYGKKTGVVCGDSRFTCQQFADRGDRLAQALQMLGVERGSRVAFLAFNCHRLLEAYYGVVQMGAVLLPLNLRLSPDELMFILNDAGAVLLFYDADFAPLVEVLRPRLHTVRHCIALDPAGRRDWSFSKNLRGSPRGRRSLRFRGSVT